ncbi:MULTISPECIES: DUF2971 domain-containing protein [unclassified Sphingobium]|uniref:DUF2971 domain-containing protein n=1 Tax=unclassified Sphingobium TaxID=2611147 RepID=UPI002225A360|nr:MULTISPECIES: DUF2971 domain-containing protein [unclassified Sphingobium]MCW2394224.1 hypothetical protein [Sphingobium sp. B8D3B]MCW2417738.1 hypothetical protein [Sphingobium sp. B8D3C]
MNRRMYWAAPNTFNDPFDCAPVPDFSGTAREMTLKLRETLRRNFPDMARWEIKRLAKSRLENRDELIDGLRERVEETRRTYGVCCFSERNDHLLMWGHYAESHKGIALRFRTAQLETPHWAPLKVEYSQDRPIVNVAKYENDELIRKTLLIKPEPWSYEQEWRLVNFHDGPGVYHFRPEFLDGIIFGAATSDDLKREIASWVKESRKPVSLYQAELDNRRYELRINLQDEAV